MPAEQLDPLLGIGCPNIIYPYLRAIVSDVCTRAGFPPILLTEVNFQAMFEAQQAQRGPGERAAEQQPGDAAHGPQQQRLRQHQPQALARREAQHEPPPSDAALVSQAQKLRAELTARLGVAWVDRGEGVFDLASVPETVRAFIPDGRKYITLGTDGFGRSDTRSESVV